MYEDYCEAFSLGYYNAWDEHCDSLPSSYAEMDRYDAELYGQANPEMAWVASGSDVWYPNPYYTGKPVPHPESDERYEDN